jgi:hydrogenase-4 component F
MHNVFCLSHVCVYLCNNLGYLWFAVETTTLLSAPLVYFNRTKHALEATWKYLIICSVGISFALLGTLFIFASSQHGAISGGSLRLSELFAIAPKLDFKLLRLGFIFCLLGYGTKAGMFPLHSWLPDAHSEAPAPSSALLSGSLLNCALFAIWRISEIVTVSQHAQLSSETTLWLGTCTVLAASLFLIRQYSLKRLFAYSSIENVGVMLFAIGLNSGPLFFFQALNHSIAKVSLFLLSGNVVQATGKKHLPYLSGLMASAPGWAVLMILSTFAGTGAPPFGTFLSEWLILIKAIEARYYLNAALLLIGLSLTFIFVCMHIGKVILGSHNLKLNYFRPIASSFIPGLLIVCSLILGLTSTANLFNSLQCRGVMVAMIK